MSSKALNARTIGKVSGRLRVRTSETRRRLPIAGSRSRRGNPFCSIMNVIAAIGSGGGIGRFLASYASISVVSTST
jgi:hypothetical protein